MLLAVRAVLPFALRTAINHRLARVENHEGRVGDVDLQLFRGAYRLHDIIILTGKGDAPEPFFAADTIDFSLAWRELFRGRVVSDIHLDAPRLRLVRTAVPVDAGEEGRRWQDVIQDIFPIEITHLEIERGELVFADALSTPPIDLSVRELRAVATGLRNRATAKTGPHPASLVAEGVTIGDGQLRLFVNGAPLAERPRFTLKLDLEEVDLPALNDLLEAHANVDVSAGTFQLYLEINAADGAFEGYAKPFFEDVEFENLSDKNKGPLRRLWESIVDFTASILRNDERGQVATRIPFSGKFERTDVGVWATIANLLRHGFVKALHEGRDEEPSREQDAEGKTLP